MANNASSPMSSTEFDEIIKMLWGTDVREEVFQRWKQGFKFSADEPTALVQNEGGPCAVLAPVQAFILKSFLSGETQNWREVGNDVVTKVLVGALSEILCQVGSSRLVLVQMVSQPSDQPCDHHSFHSQLKTLSFESREEVEAYYLERVESLGESFGVLLFLYSVMCTKGLESLVNEVSDPGESLIDSEFGYGSQSLINLMITGRAVGHVWNYDQDIAGLKLKGIEKQSCIGFLTLLEHLRYCEVGSFLKSPCEPVWVLGSETHLTVLFSDERRLVSVETAGEAARRVFRTFDPDGNNFIPADALQGVLSQLNLVSEPEYVDIMRKKLDLENLGIILLPAFMEEFFPEEVGGGPDTFKVYHYNGLGRGSRVVYQEGQAVLLESHLTGVLASDAVLTCLQTKWPSIDVTWTSGLTPSLN